MNMAAAKVKLLVLCLVFPLLGGCSTFFGRSAQLMPEIRVADVQEPADFAAAQLDAGREALAKEHYGEAIAAFRHARLSVEHAAAAHNGMAISYARIGRPDLAERYFRQAIAERPGDRRYRDNLTRFYASTSETAIRTRRTDALAVGDQSAGRVFSATTAQATIRVDLPASRITRVSENVVRISTPPAAAANDTQRRVQHLASTGSMQRANSGYPVRISLSSGQAESIPAEAAQGPGVLYPVRITLGSANRLGQ